MNRPLIYGIGVLRAVAISFSSVFLALHLSQLGHQAGFIALVISLGLFGCVTGTLLVTFFSDHIGRRKTLGLVLFLMTAGGLAMAYGGHDAIILGGAFLGMINGMGRDRGAGLTIEQSMLAEMIRDDHRTKVFAWYNVGVDLGNAVGALLGFIPAWLRHQMSVSADFSYQIAWLVYAALLASAFLMTLALSPAVELHERLRGQKRKLSIESRPKIVKFAALSGLDSFGGGFISTALLSYWFFKRFGVSESFLGPLFFFARAANSVSHLAAAWIAKKIGLVRTMVFTHLPSSVLLLTVPFAPTLGMAVFLFILREMLVEMDVPTRQSYIHAIVRPEERTLASGITNTTRGFAWASAPLLAGPAISLGSLSAPLCIGALIKIGYDMTLYRLFKNIKAPEETAGH